MPYIDDLIIRREFAVRWKSPIHSEVEEFVISKGERIRVGVVCVARGLGAENAANKYVGSRVGGITLQDGRVVDSKLADLFHKAGNSLAATIEGMK